MYGSFAEPTRAPPRRRVAQPRAPAHKGGNRIVAAPGTHLTSTDQLGTGDAQNRGRGEMPVMDYAGLFSAVAGMPLREAAWQLAAAGVPIFPCAPGGKTPLTHKGFHEATTDARRIRSWWRWMPEANIAMPTGTVSGIDVVDVDRKAAGSGFVGFDRARRAGLATGWTALVRTPSGGMHAYFPATPDRPQSSWESADAHVDFRGTGGYVVVPPSMIALPGDLRARYEVIGRKQTVASPVDASALRQFLDPRPEPSFERSTGTRVEDASRLVRWVTALREGERNRGLFWAACRLAESGVSPASALDTLGPAAENIGLPPREVFTTIRSAYRTVTGSPSRYGNETSGHTTPPHPPAGVRSQVLS